MLAGNPYALDNDTLSAKGVFYYGTLRGYGLYNTQVSAGHSMEYGYINGDIYTHAKTSGFPVLVPYGAGEKEHTGTVRGDFYPDLTLAEIPDIVSMELGVGYYLDRVEVYLESDRNFATSKRVAEAWVFAWDAPVGEFIPSGDWLVWERDRAAQKKAERLYGVTHPY